MCDCISEVNKVLAERYGDPDAAVSVGFSFKDSQLAVKPCGMEARYHARKKDGTLMTKVTKVSIVPVYCPFCGKKYDE